MDALIASAGPLRPKKRSGPRSASSSHKTVDRGPHKESIDPSTLSILPQTRLPASFHTSSLPTASASTSQIRPDPKIGKISDKKLRAKVARQDVSAKRARVEREEVDMWLGAAVGGGQGGIEVDEDEGERTWRIGQEEIVSEVGVGAGAKRFDLKLEGLGNYKVDYTKNGRHLAIASSLGHVATFDWQAGKMHSEIQLKESVRDIKFLHSEALYAVAQKKYVFMYDQNGVEIHKLKQHIDPTHLEFLSYHYLLASVGHAGHLKYHDISTGTMLTQIPTHLGSPPSMAQNPHSAILHLGHANGTMTMWSPNLTTPHVKLLAHHGPVSAIAVDPSEGSAGRYCATAGMEGRVKLWDARMWGKAVLDFGVRNAPTSIAFSGKGMLAVGGKSGVTVYRDLHSSTHKVTTPYLNLPLPALTASSVAFCPFDDLLGVGHQKGFSSLLVPGAGEANFDSNEADVFESYSRRREREVRGVLEKVRPELITMDTEFLGRVKEGRGGETFEQREARSYREKGRLERLREEGKADEEEGGEGGEEEEEMETPSGGGRKEKERHKMRGKGGSMKKYLKKKRKNVVDPAMMAMKDKIAAQRKKEEREREMAEGKRETGALARFG